MTAQNPDKDEKKAIQKRYRIIRAQKEAKEEKKPWPYNKSAIPTFIEPTEWETAPIETT